MSREHHEICPQGTSRDEDCICSIADILRDLATEVWIRARHPEHFGPPRRVTGTAT